MAYQDNNRNDTKKTGQQGQGFQNMSQEKREEAARKGGQNSHGGQGGSSRTGSNNE